MNFSALYTILITYIQSNNPEFTLFTITTFAAICKNRYITPNISEYPGPILTYFIGLVGVLVGMITPIFVWWSPKGRC